MRLNLGQLIDLLRKQDPKNLIGFDFGGCVPKGIDSYRGYYEDLAIGFVDDESVHVGDFLLDVLKSAVGKTYTGWKGGEYKMRRDSRVWVANPGHTSDTVIVGVEPECEWMTILMTKWEP